MWIECVDAYSVVYHRTLTAPYPPLSMRAAQDEPEDEYDKDGADDGPFNGYACLQICVSDVFVAQ